MRSSLILLILLLCQQTNALAEVYRWTDEKGVTHYGDKPNDSDKSEDISEQLDIDRTYSPPPEKEPVTRPRFGRNITKNILVEHNESPLYITSYLLQPPLLPRSRLLNIAKRNDSLWFADDAGLTEFHLPTGTWYLYDRRSKLPGDSVRDLYTDKDQLLLDIMDWSGKNRLINPRHYKFNIDRHSFTKSRKTVKHARNRGNYTSKNSDIFGYSPFSSLHFNNRIWLTSSKNIRGAGKWEGGVSALNPVSKRGKKYTVKDGLAHPYCYEIVASENESVWVSHWEEDRGLSVLDKQASRWKQVRESSNGVKLGGKQLASVKNYIIIGQSNGLVIYEKQSDVAFVIDHALGLPGMTIADIFIDNEHIWTTVYSSTSKGHSDAGLMKISISEIDKLFNKLKDDQNIPATEENAPPPSSIYSN